MKKVVTISMASLALVALLASGAMAGGRGQGYGRGPGYGMGPGYGQQQAISPEDMAKIDQARAAYLKDTLELRKQQATKRIELRTMTAQPNFDQKQAQALYNELVDVRAQLEKKRNQYFADLPVGPGYGGRGFRRGPGGGFGPGNCPGYGDGYGPRGGGFGPGGGYCWR